MKHFASMNILSKIKSLFGSITGGGDFGGDGSALKVGTPIVQGWLSTAFKTVTGPVRNLWNVLSGNLPAINANANIITPDYEGKFKFKLFGKLDLSNLIKFSVPESMSFGS